MIELIDVNKVFDVDGRRTQALRAIHLLVEPGAIVGVLGKSGAGKSTLLRCTNLLERPSSGKVIVDGNDLTAMSESALRQQRKKIGMIFQHFNLLSTLTAFDNIALPLQLAGETKERISERVNELLALVDLTERAHFFPAQLSGGQKQRVAIARALATQPAVLLCDEATSALDPEATQSILTLLKKINQQLGLTILLITHELDVVKRICDRVGVMHDGELVEYASVLDVFSKPSSQAAKQLIAQARRVDWNVLDKTHVVRLTFLGQRTEKAVMSDIARRYQVNTSILHADIESIQETTIGTMHCQFEGEPNDIEQAQAYLIEQGVQVEVLS